MTAGHGWSLRRRLEAAYDHLDLEIGHGKQPLALLLKRQKVVNLALAITLD
jgi:hypothetical protein